jgi:hypothetical protein
MFYGRSDADWGQLAAEGKEHLEDLAAVIGAGQGRHAGRQVTGEVPSAARLRGRAA